MKDLMILSCLLTVACGAPQAPSVISSAEADPALYGLCLVGDRIVTEPLCVCETGESGEIVWRFPLGETPELKDLRHLRATGSATDARAAAMALMHRPETFRCGGDEEGCRRMRRQVACDAEVARIELIELSAEQGDARAALRLIGDVMRAGPAHYRYETMPEELARLRGRLPTGVIEACLTQFEMPDTSVMHEPHWRPYTPDDPAPRW